MPRAKKEISKDLMFKKLMPSADSGEQQSDKDISEPDDVPVLDVQSTIPSVSPSEAQPSEVKSHTADFPAEAEPSNPPIAEAEPSSPPIAEAEPSNPPIAEPPPTASPSSAAARQPSVQQQRAMPIAESLLGTHQPNGAAGRILERTISFSHDSEGSLVNLMEKKVADNLDNTLARFNCCKCDRCKKDMIACALNALPPRYVVIDAGSPLPDIDTPQNRTEITTAIVRAVIKVKTAPRH